MKVANSLLQISQGALLGLIILGFVFVFIKSHIDVPYVWKDASGLCIRAEDGMGLDIPCEIALKSPSHVEYYYRILP